MNTYPAFEALKEQFGYQFLEVRNPEGVKTLEAHAPNENLTKPLQVVFGESIELSWEFGYFCDFMWSADEGIGGRDADAWVAEVAKFLGGVFLDQILCSALFEQGMCVGGGPIRENEIAEVLEFANPGSLLRIVSWSGLKDSEHSN